MASSETSVNQWKGSAFPITAITRDVGDSGDLAYPSPYTPSRIPKRLHDSTPGMPLRSVSSVFINGEVLPFPIRRDYGDPR